MKKNIYFSFITAILAIVFFGSCTPQRKLVYLQGDPALLNDTTSFHMRLFPGDIISVELFTINPDAFPGIGIVNNHTGMTDNRSAYEKGFVIDQSGNVSLPYIGTINLGGLTLDIAHDTIVNRFKAYIDEPVITLKKLSFKVSIIGELNRPGLFYVPNEQLTILEALAMAGDLTNYADRTAIKILRKTPQGTTEIKVDLTSKTAYTGQAKYIYPDDVVYVPPTKKKAFTTLSPATAVITSVVSTLVVIAALYLRN